MTTDLDLDGLERLEKAATCAPWVTLSDCQGDPRLIVFAEEAQEDVADTRREPDAAFIAAARTAVPVLIARVRELEARVEELEDRFCGPPSVSSF